MGCVSGKQRDEDNDAATGAQSAQEEPKAKDGNGKTEQYEEAAGEEILLPKPNDPGQVVDFDAKLWDKGGDYVIKDVKTNGLAQVAGLREEDELIGINATNIEGRGFQWVLKVLRKEVRPLVLLELKRRNDQQGPDDGQYVFIWSLFEIVIKDGQPGINVIQITVTADDERPVFDVEKTTWLGAPVEPFEIYVEGGENPDLYLGIDNGELKFIPSNKQKCTFYKYNYINNDPQRLGNLLAYSQQNFAPPLSSVPNTPSAESTGQDPKLVLMDFPNGMVTQEGIPPDPRLWFQRWDIEGRILRNMNKQDWFLAKGDDNSAILSKQPTIFQIVPSSQP